MISSAATISITRDQVEELVNRAQISTGSRMDAYAQVAQAVGSSAGWIRKFINGYEAKEPNATLYENIRANYEAFCNRVEQENRNDEKRLHALKGRRNAGTQGFGEESHSEIQTLVAKSEGMK